MSASQLSPPPVKCETCHRLMPTSAFEPGSDQCSWCVAQENVARAKEEQKEAVALMSEILDAGDEPSKLPLIEDVCAKAVDYFGGLDNFIQRWGDHFEQVLAQRPAKIGVLNHFMGVFKLIHEANAHVHTKEVDRMTAEEIRQEQQLMLLNMMSEAAVDEKRRKFIIEVLRMKEALPEGKDGE